MKTLLEMWKDDKLGIECKKLGQVIAFLGDGNIEKETNYNQLRDYFRQIDSDLIDRYTRECLADKFDKSGFVLQDLVNEIGARLDFKVEFGRYRGVHGQNGFDGKWTAKDGHVIVVESKTTDAYRINLDNINKYRKQMIQNDETTEETSSILIVVGRHDTGDLEAQIRGSRHAWNIRIISVDSLLMLLRIKENINDVKMVSQIYGVLKPQEYTKLDQLINLIFLTAQDAELDDKMAISEDEMNEKTIGISEKTNSVVASFHKECVEKIEKSKLINLQKISRSLYGTEDKNIGITMVTSKAYFQGNKKKYWFAYHPYFKDNLEGYKEQYIAYGCGSADTLFLIPLNFIEGLKDNLNYTKNLEGRMYWHIIVFQEPNGRCSLQISKPEVEYISVDEFRI